jgi:hypothetical protein
MEPLSLIGVEEGETFGAISLLQHIYKYKIEDSMSTKAIVLIKF